MKPVPAERVNKVPDGTLTIDELAGYGVDQVVKWLQTKMKLDTETEGKLRDAAIDGQTLLELDAFMLEDSCDLDYYVCEQIEAQVDIIKDNNNQ